jgi:TrmH family RNA methyltransferase
MKEIIKSNSSKTIKYIKSLQLKKNRDELGKFAIEGEKLLHEALEYGAAVSTVLFSESYSRTDKCSELEKALQRLNIPFNYAEDRLFGEVSETETPQGVIAVIEKPDNSMVSLFEKSRLCIVLLDEVRDPGNAGTIIRTADACGIDAVMLSKGCVDIYNGKTIRSTMGSMFHIPVIQNVDIIEMLGIFKQKGITSIGADPHSQRSCIGLPEYERAAIIIGNESKGINTSIKALLDMNVSIPMPGNAESLNAGIAAAILMYEFSIRKRYAE